MTKQEREAVKALRAAVRSLPPSMFIEVDDGNVTVWKQLTEGSAEQVDEFRTVAEWDRKYR